MGNFALRGGGDDLRGAFLYRKTGWGRKLTGTERGLHEGKRNCIQFSDGEEGKSGAGTKGSVQGLGY